MLDLTPLLLLAGCALAPTPVEAPRPVAAPATIADLKAGTPASVPFAALSAGREKAITTYRRYLERYPASPERREVTRRLADLLLESAADRRAAASAGRDRPDEAASIAAAHYAEAIAIYKSLLGQKESTGESRGELLYQLARAYEESGQPTRAMTLLTEMPEAPPNAEATVVYADAQFRRGELLFAAKSFAEAEQAYRRVAALGEQIPVYVQSLYKLGWSLFKQGRYDEAVEVFFTLLDHRLPPGTDVMAQVSAFSRAEREQASDVFRAVALCFSHSGGVSALAEHLAQHRNRPYEEQLYRSLGELYVTEERYSDAAQAYLALARQSPLSAATPPLYTQVIGIYEQAGFTDRTVETKAEFARAFAPHADFWRYHDPKSMPEVTQRVEASIAELAQHYHAAARQQESAHDYREAEKWYRTYLRAFGDSEQAAAMNFRLAELLYANGQYPQAASEYERTAYAYGQDPHSRSADAGYRTLLSRTEHEKTLTGQRQVSWARDSADRAIRFVESFPAHPQAAAVLATTGGKLLDHNKQAKAMQVSQRLLNKQPPIPPALRQQSAILLAQAHFESNDYAAAERGYEVALKLVKTDDPRHASLRERLAASIYRQGQDSLAKGNARQAASQFLRASRTTRGSPIQPKALYDAAAALLTLEKWAEAAALLERFQKGYPEHPLQPEAMQKLAFAYQKSGRTAEAADEYRRLGQRGQAAAVRRAALLQAADLYRQAGATDDAVAALELYLDRFPRPVSAAIAVRQQLAELAQAESDEERRRYWLEQIIEADRRITGAARNRQTREPAARAALQLAENSVTAFHRVRLVEPLESSLPRKLKAMKGALKALEQAAEYGVSPVATAATYQIAQIYQALSRELLASARPQHLSGEARAQYDLMLEEQAFPFEEKAIHFHEANARRRREGRDDPWIAKSLDRLAELAPARYAKYTKKE